MRVSFSLEDRSCAASERIRVHRDGQNEDRLCSVNLDHTSCRSLTELPTLAGRASSLQEFDMKLTTRLLCSYGPHPARRDAPYSSRAKLNVEVKFAPFACPGRRKVPGKVSQSASASDVWPGALAEVLRDCRKRKLAISLRASRRHFCLRLDWIFYRSRQ